MKKIIKINLIILMIFCLSFEFALINIYADDESIQVEENNSEEAQEEPEEEKDMDTLQLERAELKNNIDASLFEIEFIESETSTLVTEIADVTQKINDKKIEISTLEAQEEEMLKYIEVAEKEIEKSDKRYALQKETLEKRLVAIYEKGQTSYITLFLSSKNIIEALSNYYLIKEISKADNELLDTVSQEQAYNKELKEALDKKKNALADSRDKREMDAIALSNMAIIKESKLAQLSQEEQELHAAIEKYQEDIVEIETEIRLLAIANISEQYVGGTMAWPVPGYTRITSPFGMRTHPITGIYKLHTGTDIGAPMGATFVAANDGVVTYAGWNNAYGNMVIVDHGGGVTTLYAHGSEILTQVGNVVLKNDPVLKVGSTGYSTGPHAHFEVRINGNYVQPLDYITSYTNSNTEKEVVNLNR